MRVRVRVRVKVRVRVRVSVAELTAADSEQHRASRAAGHALVDGLHVG